MKKGCHFDEQSEEKSPKKKGFSMGISQSFLLQNDSFAAYFILILFLILYSDTSAQAQKRSDAIKASVISKEAAENCRKILFVKFASLIFSVE